MANTAEFTAYFRTSFDAKQFIQSLGRIPLDVYGPEMVTPVNSRGWVVKMTFLTYASDPRYLPPEVLNTVVFAMKRYDGTNISF